MPAIDVTIPHQLSQAQAMTRIQSLIANIKAEHGDKITDLHEEWGDNVGTYRFSVLGFAVSGTVEVMPTSVRLTGNLPFAASFFKNTIESTIRDRAAELLA
jgi:putative polyhydroxyalkanoic acid system protein